MMPVRCRNDLNEEDIAHNAELVYGKQKTKEHLIAEENNENVMNQR